MGASLPKMAKKSAPGPAAGGADEPATVSQKEVPEGKDKGNVLHDLEAERALSSSRLSLLLQRVERFEQALGSVKKMVEATTLPTEAAHANESLQRLEERLARLEKQDESLSELVRRVDRLENTDGPLAAAGGTDMGTVGGKGLSASVAKIEQRLAALENFGAPGSGLTPEAQKVVLAIGQLRELLGGSTPFAKEFAGLKSAAAKNSGIIKVIAVLEPFADKGIPTLASLRRRFADMSGKVFTSSLALEGDGWLERTVNKLSSLVTLRRTSAAASSGGGGGNTADAVIARVEASLAAGDLGESVAVLERLSGAPATVAAPWLADARARLAAERVKAMLHVLAVSLLGSRQE